MQPTLCSRCKKNVAVVFISKLDGEKTINEGLCLKCAKELGLPQVDDMMKRMGISDEDLETLNSEMMQAMNGVENIEDLPGGEESGEEEGDMCKALDDIQRHAEKKGEKRGNQRTNKLIQLLLAEGRQEDLLRSATDRVFQQQLFRKYHI